MSNGSRVKRSVRRRGFTLIEAMAAVAVLGIGIAGSMAAFGSIIQTETRARETEKMQRLAQAKLAELVALGQATTSSNGDFSDQNETGYTWNLEAAASGITDLDTVTLTVQQDGGQKTRLDTLLYVVPTTTTSSGGTQ